MTLTTTVIELAVVWRSLLRSKVFTPILRTLSRKMFSTLK